MDLPLLHRRLQQALVLELLQQRVTQSGGGLLNNDTSGLQRGNLGVGVTLTAGHNGTGVTHTSAWWRRDTGDERHHGLGALGSGQVVLLQELRGLLLGSTTNLTNQNDTLSLLVVQEQRQSIDEVGAGEWVSAHTNDQRLAQANLRGLSHGLVGQSTRSRNDTDLTSLVDVRGHDTDLTLVRRNQTRAVGAHQSGFQLRLQDLCNAHHVMLWDTLSDGHGERNLGLDGLLNRLGGNRWRDENTSRAGASLLHRVFHAGENGTVQVLGAGLLWVGTTHNLRAVGNRLLGVERGLFAGETLIDHFRVLGHLQVLDGGRVVLGGGGRGKATGKVLGQHGVWIRVVVGRKAV
ncbi:hypothetical protein METSCH_D03020 [Metschnikowia aff. pulcherrima]|uniref:Uncharacterized protein n=1 Tax=Metschnikowia aff. pulcherrima TaxID=2163413 RepID=A0A4P6XSW1_9ASCO|nr:hypothetical protein METSCH_D03020 [Metschnikowia aff. pulcherrima]